MKSKADGVGGFIAPRQTRVACVATVRALQVCELEKRWNPVLRACARRRKSTLLRVAFWACLVPACGDTTVDKIVPQQSAEEAAESSLHASLKLMSAIHAEFDQVRDEIETDRLALANGVLESLKDEPDTLRALQDELVAVADGSPRQDISQRVYSHLHLFAELMSNLHNEASQRRFVGYADSSDSPYWLLDVILNGDREEDVETSHYFAPAYNLLASTRIVALAVIGASLSEITRAYQNVVATNQHLIGGANDKDRGTLYDYVSSRIEGGYDADPIVYVIRRSLEEQMQALD